MFMVNVFGDASLDLPGYGKSLRLGRVVRYLDGPHILIIGIRAKNEWFFKCLDANLEDFYG